MEIFAYLFCLPVHARTHTRTHEYTYDAIYYTFIRIHIIYINLSPRGAHVLRIEYVYDIII